jgi:hypothetical protein
MGPSVAQRVDGGIDHCVPFTLDAQHWLMMHLADFLRTHVVLSRSREDGGKLGGRNTNDGAGAVFTEESVL